MFQLKKKEKKKQKQNKTKKIIFSRKNFPAFSSVWYNEKWKSSDQQIQSKHTQFSTIPLCPHRLHSFMLPTPPPLPLPLPPLPHQHHYHPHHLSHRHHTTYDVATITTSTATTPSPPPLPRLHEILMIFHANQIT